MPPLDPPRTDHAPVGGRRRPPARRVLRAIRGLRDGPAREDPRRAGSLWALATALTLLFFAVLGSAVVTVGDLVEPRRTTADSVPAAAPERVVFVPIPRATATPSVLPPPPPIEQPIPSATAVDRRPTIGRTNAPRDSGATAGAPIAPAPRQSDSSAAASAPGTGPTVEAPRAVFPVRPCDLACEIRRGEGGAGRGGGTLTTAQRDSALREAARRAREAQRRAPDGPVGPTAPSTTPVPVQQGGSVQVGLPGGGPTAAQRKRTRELDAEVSARLARIKARADSIRQAQDSAGKKP